MKYLILLLLAFQGMTDVFPQEAGSRPNSEVDEEPVLTGYISESDLTREPFSEWYTTGYDAYSPNMNMLQELMESNISNFNFVIIMGTWCPDTQEYLPQIMKVLKETEVPDDNIKIIAVDRYKKAEGIDLTGYSLERIPTLIVLVNGVEIGRIVERPRGSVEKELQRIIG